MGNENDGREAVAHVQESHDPRPVSAAFLGVLEKGHDARPLAQAFAQATQQQPAPAPPPPRTTVPQDAKS